MADGGHLKNRKIAISPNRLADFDEILYDDTFLVLRLPALSVHLFRYNMLPACDRQTGRQTDKHTTTANTCASIASRV